MSTGAARHQLKIPQRKRSSITVARGSPIGVAPKPHVLTVVKIVVTDMIALFVKFSQWAQANGVAGGLGFTRHRGATHGRRNGSRPMRIGPMCRGA
jgi:hypothetical protein